MLNLREFRPTAYRLADWLPWAVLIGPGIVLNKDGSFQRTVRYRGPDLDSATEAELMSAASRVNNVLRRFGSGWALFFDATRVEASSYPRSQFPDAVSWLVDEERRASFEGTLDAAWDDPSRPRGQHFESISHLTLMYLPPAQRVSRLETLFLENPGAGAVGSNPLSRLFRRQGASRSRQMADDTTLQSNRPGDDPSREREARPHRRTAYEEHVQRFIQETDRAIDLLASLIVGPTGAGKSVFLAVLALQFRRYQRSQLIIFDKGRSARAATLALGGAWYELGVKGGLSFQPLRNVDDDGSRLWALDWLCGVLEHERVAITPEVKETIWSALKSLGSAPVAERTMIGLVALLARDALRQALTPYTLEGPYGRFLDADADTLSGADVLTFEMEELMALPGLVAPVLTYLFHALEARFDGRPTLLVLDEAWVFLDDPLFANRIREWLKTLRKKNVAVIFATQSLTDISDSQIAPVIIESCPTRIFLPNPRALEPTQSETYRRFGLNDTQVRLIAEAFPKRDYYLQSRAGNRLFELGLGPAALAFAAASSPEAQLLIETVLAKFGASEFAERYLAARDLQWAANLISGAVAELVGIEVGVVSGVMNLESSGVEAPDRRPRHDEAYYQA